MTKSGRPVGISSIVATGPNPLATPINKCQCKINVGSLNYSGEYLIKRLGKHTRGGRTIMTHFTDGWNAISTRRKSVLIAEFLQDNGSDLGYEQWLDFLWRRLCAESTVHPKVCLRPDKAQRSIATPS